MTKGFFPCCFRQVMEQQQQRQESLERRTSTTGMYQIKQTQSALPDCLLLLLLGFVGCCTQARLLKVVIGTVTL